MHATMNRFARLLYLLELAFPATVSEDQYHALVACMRAYDADRLPADVEKRTLAESGWPETYHPCDHMERIRFSLVFGPEPDARLQRALDDVVAVADPKKNSGTQYQWSCSSRVASR